MVNVKLTRVFKRKIAIIYIGSGFLLILDLQGLPRCARNYTQPYVSQGTGTWYQVHQVLGIFLASSPS